MTTEVHTMHTMNSKGDVISRWNHLVPAEVDAAKATFDAMKAKGYLAYTLEGENRKGRSIDAFDPALEKIILVPRMTGG